MYLEKAREKVIPKLKVSLEYYQKKNYFFKFLNY